MSNKAKKEIFHRVDNVLNSVITSLGIDRRLKEHAFMNLWPSLVGEFFAKRSHCLFIDQENQLVISVKDAATGHELSLLKTQLLAKIRQTANSLGIKISGLRFDMKQYHQRTEQAHLIEDQSAETLPQPTAEQLAEVALTPFDLAKIAALKEQLHERQEPISPESELQHDIKEKILSLFEKELRLETWQRQNGFPICLRCQCPSARLHGAENLCSTCWYDSLTSSSS